MLGLLVLAAWRPELRALRGSGAATAVAGVGLIEAAAGATRAIAEVRPRAVVFVGTAGLYRGAGIDARIGDAVVVRRLHLLSSAAARGEAYFPAPLPTSATTDARLRRGLARGLPVADVACPLAITSSAAGARRARAATGCALENLEAFAVARAAASARVPFACVLGVSNVVGPDAHQEWRAHAEKAAASACAAIRRITGRREDGKGF